jgi:hypothetical protein
VQCPAVLAGDRVSTRSVRSDWGEASTLQSRSGSGAADPVAISLQLFERQTLDFVQAIESGKRPLVDEGLELFFTRPSHRAHFGAVRSSRTICSPSDAAWWRARSVVRGLASDFSRITRHRTARVGWHAFRHAYQSGWMIPMHR